MPLAASMKRKIVVAAIVIVALAALLVYLSPSLYEVEEKGRGPGIVPYESGLVYKVRVLDRFNVYASDESAPDTDQFTSLTLAAMTTMTLMTLALLSAVGARPRLRRFYLLATAGLALLTLDESFGIHETVGHNMQFLSNLPGVERPDDLIFTVYPVAAAVFAWCFRDILFADRRAVRVFAVGGLLVLVAVVGDVLGFHVDEAAEPLAGLCLAAGLVVITAATLRRELLLAELLARAEKPGDAALVEEHSAR